MIRCRSCGQSVKFIKTVHGKSMPVDDLPHPEGNLSIEDGVAHVLVGETLDIARARGAKLFRSHFATCPKAGAHRKKR